MRTAVSTLWRPISRKLGKRQLQRKGGAGIDGVHAIALGHDLAQESFLRAEVVEKSRGGHSDSIRQRRHPCATVSLGGEELRSRVNDLLAAEVTASWRVRSSAPAGSP